MCHRSTAEGCDLLLNTPMPKKVVLLTAHKSASPSLLLPSVRCFSRVGSSWFHTMLTQPFFPLSCMTVVKSWLVRSQLENDQCTTISWASMTQPSLLILKYFICSYSQGSLWTSWTREMGPFTQFQWSGNRSSDMAHNLIKIAQLLSEQQSNVHEHQFIIGQVKRSAAYL